MTPNSYLNTLPWDSRLIVGLGVVGHTSNPSTEWAGAGGSEALGQPELCHELPPLSLKN
jgi:hypothetical protein